MISFRKIKFSKLKRYPGDIHNKVARFSYTGSVLAVLFFCASVTPSLLPRPWLLQGLITAASALIGYGIGSMIGKAIRWMLDDYKPSKKLSSQLWKAYWFVSIPLVGVFLFQALQSQAEIRKLLDLQPAPAHTVKSFIVGIITFWILLFIVRVVRLSYRKLLVRIDYLLPRRLSIGLSVVIVVLCMFWIFSGLFANFFFAQARNIYKANNSKTAPGVLPPSARERSGSPDSLVHWSSLGREGRLFVASGPDIQKLTDFSSTPKTPIRVYIGVESADTASKRAQLAVEELKRTGAFERKILVLATPTGSGWLEQPAVDSIEYIHGGDTAIVAQQYSYLPSWISFLADKETARDGGRELHSAVLEELHKYPVDKRPKLISYGLSLGSFGGQAPFSGAGDMQVSLDGALFVGSPNQSEPWRSITDSRDTGSKEIKPIYRQARHVRFATNND